MFLVNHDPCHLLISKNKDKTINESLLDPKSQKFAKVSLLNLMQSTKNASVCYLSCSKRCSRPQLLGIRHIRKRIGRPQLLDS